MDPLRERAALVTLLSHPEVREFLQRLAPFQPHILDSGRPRPLPRPCDELIQNRARALAHDLDGAIVEVSGVAAYAERPCLPGRRSAKKHALNSSAHDNPEPHPLGHRPSTL